MTSNAKQKRRLTKKGKRKLILFIIMLILIVIAICYFTFTKPDDGGKKKVVDEIEKFSYTVSDSDTKLFKDTFKELKKLLSQDDYDKSEYAKLVSELFIIDFYTLDNKVTKNDVGGVQFVYTPYQSQFIDKARDSLYKQVISNIDNDRSQQLPEVDSVEVVSIEDVVSSSIFDIEDFKNVTDTDSYEVQLKWTYKNNDNFQNEATLVLVKDSDKYSVAKLD